MSKTVLITGAGRGLGKCLAEVFGGLGYQLVLHNGRSEGDLQEPTTILSLKKLAEQWDIDILIHNAGVYLNSSFSETSSAEFRDILETNLLAPIFLTKAIWPVFKKKRSGMVVFINSVAGKVGSPGELAYCTSKFGLKGFADSLQFDGVRDNVRVISIYLGEMDTQMTECKGGDPKYKINPHEAALRIFDACKYYEGAEASEITIDRIGKRYA